MTGVSRHPLRGSTDFRNGTIRIASHLTVLICGLLVNVRNASAEHAVSCEAVPQKQLLFESGKDGYPRYRIPSLVVTTKGTLIAVCEGRADGGGLTGNVDLVCRRSFDGASTWSKLQIVADAGRDTLGNASALVDRRSGVIWIVGTISPGEYSEEAITRGASDKSTRVFVISSRDDGETWTEPRDITEDVKRDGWTWYGCGPGVGIQLHGGRLLFPCYHREGANGKTVSSHTIFSDDQGVTWRVGGNAGPGNGEPQMLQREDGSIYLSARTRDGLNLRSIVESTDGGETWSEKRFDESLYDPFCQASLLNIGRHKDAPRWLYCHPAGPERRDLTVRLSLDEGQSWNSGSLLIHRGNSQYSSMALLPNGKVGVLFDVWERNNYQLYFSRFNPDRIARTQRLVFRAQGEFAGEVTSSSVLLQTRLTETPGLNLKRDIAGALGVVRFEFSNSEDFTEAKRTDWIPTSPETDFIARAKVSDLKHDTQYFYRVLYGPDRDSIRCGPTRRFRTLPGQQLNRSVSFCVGSCMIYHRFVTGTSANRLPISTTERDRRLGYPAFAAMNDLRPDFFVGTGDIVYYDWPRSQTEPAARTLPELRKKWHEQFRFPRLINFFGRTPAYWSKDDHDFRFDDADLTGEKLPLPQTGIDLFREQLPIAPAGDLEGPAYRTYRVSRHLQIWLTEGRDHRSPKSMEDGPGKSLWGKTQREWLQRTLAESGATWKILISPTPMVGPDGKHKKDNHTNLGGYRHEAQSFFDWLKQNRIQRVLTVCGDRHWQYHSIHPSGMEEFGCGALNDENAILGHSPGDPRSTDPDGLIRQPFKYSEPTGGFLHIQSFSDGLLRIEFRDDRGEVLHTVHRLQAFSPFRR